MMTLFLVIIVGILPVLVGVVVCPFGLLWWWTLGKNMKSAPPLAADTFYEEFERQLAILHGKPDPLLMNVQEARQEWRRVLTAGEERINEARRELARLADG